VIHEVNSVFELQWEWANSGPKPDTNCETQKHMNKLEVVAFCKEKYFLAKSGALDKVETTSAVQLRAPV